MLLGLINYVRGNVRVEIRGAAIERFLNLCAQNQIAFWDVRRLAPDTVQATVRIEGFRQLRRFTRRMMCSEHIVRKRGVTFQAHRLLPRVALWGGALLCIALLAAASKFIWTIDVSTCDHALQAEVLRLTEEAGLHTGALSRRVDTDAIRNYVMLHSDNFSFLAVNIKGSRAQIVAHGRAPAPEMVPVGQPCDIVADKTGIIADMQVKAGLGLKKVGETVMEGDILVAGTIVSAQQEMYQVHAMADVELRTWHTVKTVMPTKLRAKAPTGRVRTRYALVVGTRRMNLSLIEKEPFACYDKFVEKKPLKLTDDTVLPAALVIERYVEYEEQAFDVSEAVCRDVLQQRLRETLSRRLPEAQVVQTDFLCEYGQPFAVAKLTVECREKTGILKEVSGITLGTSEDS